MPTISSQPISAVPPSATLAANERVQAKLAAGDPVLHLAFGEAGLPVLPSVADALAGAAGRNGYGSVAGSPREHDLLILSDEIYRDLAHEPGAVCSPAEVAPERAFVTNGLSKSMALGGWRIGFARLPDGRLGADAHRALTGLASEVWSCLAAPMQQVAAHAEVVAAGATCRAPSGGFYLYPDLEPARAGLSSRGVETGAQLAELLLERHDVAVLAGEAFGDEPSALRFRMATSLLYGATDDERWETLAADDPVSLPRIRTALERLGQALRDVMRV